MKTARIALGFLTGFALLAASLWTARAAEVSTNLFIKVDPNGPPVYFRIVPMTDAEVSAAQSNAVPKAVKIAPRAQRQALAAVKSPPPIEDDEMPNLISAKNAEVELLWLHSTATKFTIRIVHQNEGDPGPTVTLFDHLPAKQIAPQTWTAKVKLQGDTNSISVRAINSTNFSNGITVIP